MKKFFLPLVLFLMSCDTPTTINYSKDNHSLTIVVGDELYMEIYTVYSGGVFASDVITFYLTDSISFRKYVGTKGYDDQGVTPKLIDNNNVIITRSGPRLFGFGKDVVLEEKTYNIPTLKKEGKFE